MMMNLRSIHQNVQHHGVEHTFYDLAYRAVNRVVLAKVLNGITIDRVDPKYLACDSRYRCLFLDPDQLRALARDPANELSREFLDEALGKGDECYGILDGARVASYGWYARTPTVIDPPELRLRFSPQFVYMYKGFTHAQYRGQRLHAIGMTRALESYLARGYKGLVSYVEANNFASLKSVYRMGYTSFGRITLMRIAGRYLARASHGCRRYGFGLLAPAAAGAPGQVVTEQAPGTGPAQLNR